MPAGRPAQSFRVRNLAVDGSGRLRSAAYLWATAGCVVAALSFGRSGDPEPGIGVPAGFRGIRRAGGRRFADLAQRGRLLPGDRRPAPFSQPRPQLGPASSRAARLHRGAGGAVLPTRSRLGGAGREVEAIPGGRQDGAGAAHRFQPSAPGHAGRRARLGGAAERSAREPRAAGQRSRRARRANPADSRAAGRVAGGQRPGPGGGASAD